MPIYGPMGEMFDSFGNEIGTADQGVLPPHPQVQRKASNKMKKPYSKQKKEYMAKMKAKALSEQNAKKNFNQDLALKCVMKRVLNIENMVQSLVPKKKTKK